MYGYVIFTDIEKYSSLKDADLKIYFNKIIPIISQDLKTYKDSAIIWNTWGDAIFAIYDKAESAINMALAYREAFNKLDFDKFGIRKLTPRIAGNFGEFELIYDPVSGKKNVHGTLVNLTARIEPVTTPGEIFVTKEFKDMSISSYDKVNNVRFEDMGEIKLPKNAGSLNLFRLCKRAEAPIRPAGLIVPNIDYKVQVNIVKPEDSEKKPALKSIEQRLIENSNKKISSEEKLNKLANILKDDKNLPKKETSLIKKLKNYLDIQDMFTESPALLAIYIYLIAISINFVLDLVFAKNMLGLNINNGITGIINPWLWIIGFTTSSFTVGQVVIALHKKLLKFQNLIITPFLVTFLYLFLYILPTSSAHSTSVLKENFLINSFILWIVCFMGFSKGVELANDKIKASTRKK